MNAVMSQAGVPLYERVASECADGGSPSQMVSQCVRTTSTLALVGPPSAPVEVVDDIRWRLAPPFATQ
jgi:hypothetical protein